MLALDSGLRLGELCALTMDDVNLRERFVTVRADTSKSKKAHEVGIGYERKGGVRQSQRESGGLRVVKPEAEAG